MGLLEELARVVGSTHVLIEPDQTAGYETDWTGRFHGEALAVVRPADALEVAAVIDAAARHGHRVMVQGGNTGLVGGSVPAGGEVLLSTLRLNGIARDGTDVVAGAGAKLEAVQAEAAAMGRRFAVDIASRGSATVGGMIATDAKGAFAGAVGGMGDQVLEISGMSPRGPVTAADGLVGSEGTAAVVTSARLRTIAPRRDSITALVPVPTVERAAELAARCAGLLAAEVLTQSCAALTGGGLPPAARREAWVVILDADGGPETLAPALEDHPEALVGTDAATRARLWAIRHELSEAVVRRGVPHKVDVTLSSSQMDAFADVLELPDGEVYLYGHLGHDSLHVNVVGPPPEDHGVDAALYDLAESVGGSAVGEHGVGRVKVDRLDAVARSERVATKRRWDPDGLLNPGVLVSGPD